MTALFGKIIIIITIIKSLKEYYNICCFLFPHFYFLKKKPLTEKRSYITNDDTHVFSQDIIKISLLILLTVSHTVLVMLVWRICYWINLKSPD